MLRSIHVETQSNNSTKAGDEKFSRIFLDFIRAIED